MFLTHSEGSLKIICVYISVCIYLCVYMYICTCVYMYVHCACIDVCTHTHTHREKGECTISLIGSKPRASSDYYLETSYLMRNPAEREMEPEEESLLRSLIQICLKPTCPQISHFNEQRNSSLFKLFLLKPVRVAFLSVE